MAAPHSTLVIRGRTCSRYNPIVASFASVGSDVTTLVSELPSGTVSLLFSDIEGSTLLLTRLGPRYVEALDGQRRVLRDGVGCAWRDRAGHRGGQLLRRVPLRPGRRSRPRSQAQRELDEYPWPGGERVRVRIGIHTGSPQVHDGQLRRDGRAPRRPDRRIGPRWSGGGVGRHRGPGARWPAGRCPAAGSRQPPAEGHRGGGASVPAR